jgi:hypothetical protein
VIVDDALEKNLNPIRAIFQHQKELLADFCQNSAQLRADIEKRFLSTDIRDPGKSDPTANSISALRPLPGFAASPREASDMFFPLALRMNLRASTEKGKRPTQGRSTSSSRLTIN